MIIYHLKRLKLSDRQIFHCFMDRLNAESFDFIPRKDIKIMASYSCTLRNGYWQTDGDLLSWYWQCLTPDFYNKSRFMSLKYFNQFNVYIFIFSVCKTKSDEGSLLLLKIIFYNVGFSNTNQASPANFSHCALYVLIVLDYWKNIYYECLSYSLSG